MNSIEKYGLELILNARKYLKLFLNKPGQEELHRLRVEIKKIHALHHFLSYCYKDNFGRNKELKKLFRRAGKIRNLQMTISLLEKQMKVKCKEDKKLLEKLKSEQDSRIKKFRHHYSHYQSEIFKKTLRMIKKSISMKTKKETALYFSMMKEKIMNSVQHPNPNKKETHLLRKEIKTLKYNLQLPVKVEKKYLIEEKLLGKWEKLLGEWHDAVQLTVQLKRIKNEAKPELHLELQRIGNACDNKRKSLFDEFSRLKPI